MADRAYNLETTTFTAPKAKPHGTFYRIIKRLGGGGPFGILLASVFKVYGRRFHNLSWLAYVVCIAAFFNMFIIRTDEPEEVVMLSSFLFSLLAAIVASDVTIRGKETLFIYKKTPSGVGRFVKARLLQGWLVAVPIAAVITAVSMILTPQTTLIPLLIYIGFTMQLVAANVTLSLALSLINPEFSQNTRAQMLGLMINGQVAMFTSVGSVNSAPVESGGCS